jgi:folate-dependent phosphoribosylglycinamide formyltransferase PurN
VSAVRTFVYTFESPVTLAVAGRLAATGKIAGLILQRPMKAAAKLALVRRRLKRYGVVRVGDELLFQLFYRLFLEGGDQRLRRRLDLRTVTKAELARAIDVFEVDSLNTAAGRALLERLRPDLVVMMSREMLATDVLSIPRLGFVGCHPGILPDYRGVYAPFWAMRDGRPDKIGLTVYVANGGVDTGPLIAERRLPPQFTIRHFKVECDRLMIEGAQDLIEVIEQAENGGLRTYTKPTANSRLFTHIGLSHFVEAVVHAARRERAAA